MRATVIPLRKRLKLVIHWPDTVYHPLHGPQTWEWWRLFGLLWCQASPVEKPTTGYHLWAYTRWGATMMGFYFDRRKPL